MGCTNFSTMDRKRKTKVIAIFVNSSWQAYNFRLSLAKNLSLNYKVIFFGPYDKRYVPLIEEKFTYVPLRLDPKGVNILKEIRLIKDLILEIKKNKISLLLNFTIKPNIYGSISAKFMNIPVINNITGLGTTFIKENILTKVAIFLYKFIFRLSQHNFFQNDEDLNLFIERQIINKNYSVLPGSGVDVNYFKRQTIYGKHGPSGAFKFAMISRFIKDKGVLEYVNASKEIVKFNPDIKVIFEFIGEMDVQNKTKIPTSELKKIKETGVINFLPKTDNIKRYLEEVDCVVLPSYREGSPRSIMEASSMEIPVIVSNAPGCRSVVDNNKSGFFCEIKSSKDLSKKMFEMLNLSIDQRAKMGALGREKMAQFFSEEIVINEYLNKIKELIR